MTTGTNLAIHHGLLLFVGSKDKRWSRFTQTIQSKLYPNINTFNEML